MLRFLRIRNLAVVESVDVEFEPGFNVLTGETGAGKSIIVEAVGLLLGDRASSDLVRTGETQATIEAIFEVSGTAGAEPHELVIRRDITDHGRSRSFINGALATAGALRDLSRRLVELHGQHEHQALLDPSTHLPLLDSYAGLESDAATVGAAWTVVRSLREQLDRSRMDAREKSARLELIAFQLSEIEKASPKAGEDEELAATKQVLASAERIQRLCEESYSSLYESDAAILSGLGGVWKRVGELATIDPKFAPYVDARWCGRSGPTWPGHLRRPCAAVRVSPRASAQTIFCPSLTSEIACVGQPWAARMILSSGAPSGSITIATPSSSRSKTPGAQKEQFPEPMHTSRSMAISSVTASSSGPRSRRPT